jgi:multidrug efflux pump subunit AcrA (membrane-fusion protein)
MATTIETKEHLTAPKNSPAPSNLTETRNRPLPTTKRFPWAWLLLPGGIVAAAALFVLLPPSVPVTQLATMRVRDEAVGVGYVQAKVPVSASAKINGVIRKVYVDQGDHVAKGQVLAQFENEDYRSQIAQADSQLQATQAMVSSARAEFLAAQSRAQASRSPVARNRAGLTLAKTNYDRARQPL